MILFTLKNPGIAEVVSKRSRFRLETLLTVPEVSKIDEQVKGEALRNVLTKRIPKVWCPAQR